MSKDLPEFGSSRAANSTEGIRPEDIAAAQAQVGMASDPGEVQRVQSTMDAEVDRLAGHFGHETTPQAAPRADTPPTPEAAPDDPTPQPDDDTLEARISRAKQKYGNDLDAIAKAYVHTDAARTRAQQQSKGELDTLRRSVEDLNATVAALLTPPTGGQRDLPPPPRQQQAPPETQEDFYSNPEAAMRRIVQETVQQNLVAYDAARTAREQEARLGQLQQEQAAEIERLRPRMARIYTKNRDLYDGLASPRIVEDLLERAKAEEAAAMGAEFYREIQGMDIGADASQPQPGPGAQSRTTSTSGRVPGRQTSITNYSGTQNMQRLQKVAPESADEMQVLTEVLRERGFGEDVKV